jgi:hypothetical protein
MIWIAPPRFAVGATAGRDRGVVEGRVADDGTDARFAGDGVDARFVDDGVDGAEGTLASAGCVAWATRDSRTGSVEGSVLGVAGSLVGAGATVGAAAAAGAGAETCAATRGDGVIAGVMMRSANT